ncbi:trypsin-1-like isoform X2 [Amphibalanus amphitrite]|uniref:trypsin-1-like isoform X2 n=1 Tax=Amphibalanus amphitrite TaxID=1232801 RepID=UPI001C919764|nr:trypsin-1-like isoform X2 [Amphibalanus amphitrite]
MTPRQTRVFPLFEYLTPNGRFIPGLAKNSHCCGKENMFEIFVGARIVGGEVTTPFQYPWMVAIVLAADVPTRTEMGKDFAKTGASEKEERHISLPICGGALLNDRYVVTSSECVAPHSAADIVVMLGKFLSSTDPERYTFNVVQDIGEPSSTLRTVDLRTISNSECGDYLGEDTIEKSMICAGAKIVGEGGAGPCTYDLGGPLIIRTWYDRDRFTLIGIATNRTGCGQPGVPAVFTRVYSFLDWLLDNMEDAVYC